MFMTARPDRPSLRWCFSTLGCADLSFPEICRLASEFHIPGIELRGFNGRMDMPQYCAEQNQTPEQMLETCQRHQTQLVMAGTSVKLTGATQQDRAELLIFSEWAEGLRIPFVRVFGGGIWGDPLSDQEYAHAAALVRWWREEKAGRQWKVDLLLETHDAFSGSEPCLELNRRLTHPLHLIWDSHHTWRVGGEPLHDTWNNIGHLVRHVQIKDSVDQPSARHPYTYVLPGDGQMPLRILIELMRRESFDGFVSLEWERHWHPYLPPLRAALQRLRSEGWFT